MADGFDEAKLCGKAERQYFFFFTVFIMFHWLSLPTRHCSIWLRYAGLFLSIFREGERWGDTHANPHIAIYLYYIFATNYSIFPHPDANMK